MKNETKYKIIQWVTRVLKYKQPVCPPIIKQERKIQEVQYKGHLYDWDAKYNLKHFVVSGIIGKLMDLNVVNYRKEKDPEGGYIIYGNVFFIKPFDKS